MNTSAKKVYSYLIKAGIILLAFVFIYRRSASKHELLQFETLIAGINRTWAISIMSLVFLLMLLNWILEAAKWRYLAKSLAHLTLWRSIESVFCGLVFAVFTPNRLGEYGGRVMFLPSRKRIHGVFAMAVGSFGQNVVTNVMGAGSCIIFGACFLNINIWLYLGLFVLLVAFMVFMVLCYFNIKWMVVLLDKIKFMRKFHRFFDIMGRYTFTELLRIMGFCVARFAVFSFEYYLLIHLFIPAIPGYDIFLMIFIMFFIQSALPSLDLFEIGVRNITAWILFSYVTDQKVAIVASITTIWFINIIIPAILGSVFVFKLRFFDNNI